MPAGIGRPPGSMPVAAYVLQVDLKLQPNATVLMLSGADFYCVCWTC